MTENPQITKPQMAEQTGLPITTIPGMISNLKNEGRVARIGTSRNGHWQVLKDGEEPAHFDSPDKRKQHILQLIIENPKITRAQMAEQLGVSKITIHRIMNELKEENRVERIGTTRGYWKMLQNEANAL